MIFFMTIKRKGQSFNVQCVELNSPVLIIATMELRFAEHILRNAEVRKKYMLDV